MIQIVEQKISSEGLRKHLGDPFDDMIKFVVDIHKQIMSLGGRLHADGEKILLESGSCQENLWGGNWYPNFAGDKRIEIQKKRDTDFTENPYPFLSNLIERMA